jgi:disulfide bond formation protein DsbB
LTRQLPRLSRANLLALAVPSLLMAGALGSQYIGGLYPCDMCHWQRWPHDAAIGLAILALFLKPPVRTTLIALAAIAILISGGIGVFHAGVEYGWWQGLTTCTNTAQSGSLADIMAAPLVRCDVPQWTLFGISLAGFNAIFSIAGGLGVFALLRRTR